MDVYMERGITSASIPEYYPGFRERKQQAKRVGLHIYRRSPPLKCLENIYGVILLTLLMLYVSRQNTREKMFIVWKYSPRT